jgi:hypothetical protein
VTIPIAERAKPRRIQIAAGHKLFAKEQSAVAV